ncbi:hypothetical protein [Ramlibacter montanisoli]|uniref:hypothetical protein n=1 Tax=Ramlibacter montanisoli TaxID=2732512 RepID=UPI0035A0D975
MVCSKGLRYSKRKRFGRWNSKVPLEFLVRAAWPSRAGAVITCVKSARPVFALRTKFSRLSMAPAWAAAARAVSANVANSFFIAFSQRDIVVWVRAAR